MSQSPSSPRPWWRQPPLWVGAGPLLVFLVVSAIDLALAKKFTDQGQTLISTLLGGALAVDGAAAVPDRAGHRS